MKGLKRIFAASTILILVSALIAFMQKQEEQPLQGAWLYQQGDEHQVLIFVDGYFTHTGYNLSSKKFNSTHGGPYTVNTNQLATLIEFDTRNKDAVGDTLKHLLALSGNKLTLHMGADQTTFNRIDGGIGDLAGLWKISARRQGDSVVPIHQTGTRKTIKILTGTRFQWAAINPGTKEFSGTGGGTYTFENGKYTERIEFFSRDSSRVGAILTFDGKLEKSDWHHSGKSSKGDPIYEVWSRSIKQ
jgi:hypothetical protein